VTLVISGEQVVVPLPGRTATFEQTISVGPTARVRRLLRIAAARDDGRSEIDTDDVLLALTRDERSGPLLAHIGVGEVAVRRAIERRRVGEEPSESSSQG
jgi:hypothetical protein